MIPVTEAVILQRTALERVQERAVIHVHAVTHSARKWPADRPQLPRRSGPDAAANAGSGLSMLSGVGVKPL